MATVANRTTMTDDIAALRAQLAEAQAQAKAAEAEG